MERFTVDTTPHGDQAMHGEEDDQPDQRVASLAAFAFLVVVVLSAAAIVAVQHVRSAVDDCAVQEGGVCVALSGR